MKVGNTISDGVFGDKHRGDIGYKIEIMYMA